MQKIRKLKDLSDEEKRELARIIKKLREEKGLYFKEIKEILEKKYKISISLPLIGDLYYSNFLYPYREDIILIYKKMRERNDEEIINEIYKIDDKIKEVSRGRIEDLVKGLRWIDGKYYSTERRNAKQLFCLYRLYILLGYRQREVRKLLGYRPHNEWTKEKIEEVFLEWIKEEGRVPTKREFREKYPRAYSNIKKVYGGWSEFIISQVEKFFSQNLDPKLIESIINIPSHSLYSLIDKHLRKKYGISLEEIRKIGKVLGFYFKKNPSNYHLPSFQPTKHLEVESIEKVDRVQAEGLTSKSFYNSQLPKGKTKNESQKSSKTYIKTTTYLYARHWQNLWKDKEFSENYQYSPQRVATEYLLKLLFKEEIKGLILDLASGKYSPLIRALEENNTNNLNVIAVDVSEDALKFSNKKTDCICAYSPYLPFRDSSFDFVVISQFLGEISSVQKLAHLLSIDRVLKKGGKLIIVESEKGIENEKSIEEIECYLEDMDYLKEKVERYRVNWKDRIEPTYLHLMIYRKKGKDLRNEESKQFAIHEVIDGNILKVKQIYSNINEILKEIKSAEKYRCNEKSRNTNRET